VGNYISARCPLYIQHLHRARKGKARLHPENPLACSCVVYPFLVSRSCLRCFHYIWRTEIRPPELLTKRCYMVRGLQVQRMGKRHDAGRKTQDQDFESLMVNISKDFGSSEADLDVTIRNRGDDHFSNDRVDGLSHRAIYDENRDTPSIHGRKQSTPAASSPSGVAMKRKTDPSPEIPHYDEPTTSSPLPIRPSPAFEPSKKSLAKPLSTMCEEEYRYRQRVSLNDRIYFDNVIKKLRTAPYLPLQTEEPTISSQAGVSLVGEGRAEGPGRARGDDSVYAILVDRPSSGPFLCWICGHPEKQRKVLRALGHLREHFEHKPWECTQDHQSPQNGDVNPKKRRGTRKDGPWRGPLPITITRYSH
jgi:hypothetical protein